MTDAQRVAAHYRSMSAELADDTPTLADEYNAIADVVEAGDTDDLGRWDAALAKLAKAVGVEGENNG